MDKNYRYDCEADKHRKRQEIDRFDKNQNGEAVWAYAR
jgi:hypothetical protein